MGRTEFQEQAAYELFCTWQRAQVKWIKLRSFIEHINGTNPELNVVLTQFRDRMRGISSQKEDEDVDLGSASELGGRWKKVKERLQSTENVRIGQKRQNYGYSVKL